MCGPWLSVLGRQALVLENRHEASAEVVARHARLAEAAAEAREKAAAEHLAKAKASEKKASDEGHWAVWGFECRVRLLGACGGGGGGSGAEGEAATALSAAGRNAF